MIREGVLNTLKDLKPELNKVREIALFGSFVREEQNASSDIDVLVDLNEDAGLFDLIRVGLFLEEKLHRKVDVIPKESLREEIRESVLQEIIVLRRIYSFT